MKLSIRDITHIGIFTALTAIGAFISLPIGPVPITLQSFFILMSGIILGSKKAMLSQIVYLLLGLAGLPIFAGFSGGVQTIVKPSFGFLIGYIIAAYFVGKFLENKSKTTKNLSIAVVMGTLIIYAIGLPYMYYVLNLLLSSNFNIIKILKIGMLVFIPGDTLKAIIAVFIGRKLQGKLNK
ncbi:MAG: biotin transporter BioY [Sedimentibacter sp.]|uniref:biotin transporter BioY n=1 Tax=Sedimentibacter sp. TaxID=1960295 RepID=UPI0029811B24|nr:biotin transporter BioY [Sedimentibacter sp.]MDW5299842.1 biotin transporter BioY [Sedimentibacter sp.]